MSALTQNIVSRLRLNPDSPFARGLVGCWLMGNRACWRSAKLLDLSPYNNHGVLTNMDPQTDWVHDGERAGLDFDGASGNHVRLPPSNAIFTAASPWTIRLLLLPKTVTGTSLSHRAIDFYRNAVQSAFIVSADSGNLVYWTSPGGTRTLISIATTGMWYDVCVSYDGSTFRAYVNGNIVDTFVRTFDGFGDGNGLLGAYDNGSSLAYLWDGLLDAVLIHNRALTAAEIAQLYEETRDGSYGSLVLTDEGRRQTTTVFIPKVPDKPIMRDVVAQRVKTSDYLELNTDSPLTKGLVGCWLMGNRACWRSNKLLDLSPYRNHGVLTNMDPQTDWVHDGERAWLEFDGVDDYVVVPGDKRREHMPDLVSVVAWSIGDRTNDTEPIIVWDGGSADAYSLRFKDAGTSSLFGPTFGIMTSGGSYSAHETTNPLPDGPQFLVGTYDGSSVRLYRNGDEVASAVTDGTPITYSSFGNKGILIHARDPSVLLRGGKSDFILVYNRALSANEVKQLYNETKNGGYGSLVRQRSITHISEEPKYASSIRTSVPTIITSSKTRDNTARSLRLNPDSPLSRGLVFWMPAGRTQSLDAGFVQDISVYGRHASTNGTTVEIVKKDKRWARRFKDSNDQIELDYTIMNGLNSVTVSWWQWFDGTVANYSIFSNAKSAVDNEFLIWRASDAVLYLYRDNDAKIVVVSNPNMLNYEGQWSHFTIIQNYDRLQVWAVVNGNKRDVSSIVSSKFPVQISPGGSFIGQEQDSIGGGFDPAQRFTGWLDDFRIYNRALSDGEARQLYYETKDGGYGSLVL